MKRYLHIFVALGLVFFLHFLIVSKVEATHQISFTTTTGSTVPANSEFEITFLPCTPNSSAKITSDPTGIDQTVTIDSVGVGKSGLISLDTPGDYRITAECDGHTAFRNLRVTADPATSTPTPGAPSPSSEPGGTSDKPLAALQSIFQNKLVGNKYTNIGSLLSDIYSLAFTLAGIALLVFLFVGVLQYILAGGNKEGLAKARARITWAIVGFILFAIAFALTNLLQQVLPSRLPGGVTEIREPK